MLLIIDGSSLASRAFFAGEPLDYFNMAQQLMDEVAADYVVHIFDDGTPGYRKGVYPAYKQGRKTNPDRVDVIKRIYGALQVAGNEVVLAPEADDAIASIARAAKNEVVIYSSDTDLWQLIGDNINCLWCARTFSDRHLVTLSEVYERYGVPPQLIPEYIGLAGEGSDNIPGVRGLGDVGARLLLETYRSADAAFEHVLAHGATNRYEKKLMDPGARKLYNLSKLLATLRVYEVDLKD